MMIISVVPTFFLKKPAPAVPAAVASDSLGHSADSAAAAVRATGSERPAAVAAAPSGPDSAARVADDTVVVRSPLYTYRVSTRGARLVGAALSHYRSMAPADSNGVAELVRPGSSLLDVTLLSGRDTLRLDRWAFTPSARALDVSGAGAPLTLTATEGGVTVALTYTFHPDDYQIEVRGQARGLPSTGGLAIVSLGSGIRNTESDTVQNHQAAALVTKSRNGDAHRIDFSSLKPGIPDTVSGPFEWVAVKSKYFVTALLAFDSTSGGVTGAQALAPVTPEKRPTSADVRASVVVPASGAFGYTLYAGPLEYSRLSRVGHGFDDVNPYGWPGFRTIIRPVAIAVRSLLVWMHVHLHLPYGLVLTSFGILVRLLLWPLNQKAMRASMQMQAIQPLMKQLQDRHKEDPQKQQQEMFKLYKEHKVNPLGGCWPMLLPMPVLLALFFVFQNTIELRGAPFLWLPDLSQPDPLFIIPLLMGLSMFGLTKVGQMGMEPNPQMKMTMYLMPVVMTFVFLKFASGLNLYYAVSNVASIPQQWLLARERVRRAARMIVEIKTKDPRARV